jgi:hypothetical protein
MLESFKYYLTSLLTRSVATQWRCSDAFNVTSIGNPFIIAQNTT